MPQFIRVAAASEVPPGQAKLLEVNGNEIAVFNVAGSFYAIDNSCSHVGGPLCEGDIDGIQVTCPWHGAVFDVTSGRVMGPPAASDLNRYNVRVAGADIELEV